MTTLAVDAKTLLYADDTTFFNSSHNLNELKKLTDTTINKASIWLKENGFLMNETKTQNILFTLKSIPENSFNLESSSVIKILGIHIDNNLSLVPHIDFLSTKLSRIIFLLRRLSCCISENYVRTAYFGYFQSILRYGLIL
ncbi:hypothetical protein J6590_108286 [Homalodisca vitripennis]|nr:hypothetical protein J6590_108286 [Homalodisca vitripennis]